ncbi:Uncharacterised protein [Candidatus Bilamarchaeum dharawalense]|uniref:DUF2085 domain-containing protein n=1 Tax=Candidatus Bilamarchaeum dharawalense TaxID=2885759 RepID=A0A5E4LT89_9ARCH|nr:Uncharacterised protein [Candidatus Bilamarchaeum dharawalense]
MKSEYIIYIAYVVFFLLLVGAAIYVPILAFNEDATGGYVAFSYTCHQKISRSLCIFNTDNSLWIGDCTLQNGTFIDSRQDRTTTRVETGSTIGYKIPICARDLGIYTAMLLAALVYPFVRKIDDTHVYPAIFLIIAIVPLGLDGTVQLLSELGILPFIYESTNMTRLLTGLLAGFAATFYAIPILMNMFRSKAS